MTGVVKQEGGASSGVIGRSQGALAPLPRRLGNLGGTARAHALVPYGREFFVCLQLFQDEDVDR